MRKQDIKPGVVYAYQRGTYGNPLPVVFLNTPADGELYTEGSQWRKPGSKAFTRAHGGSKPHAVSFGSDVGYPVVRGRWDADTDPPSLWPTSRPRLKPTVAATSSASSLA